jgi:hypothetical protein
MFRLDVTGTETVSFTATPSNGSALHPLLRLFDAAGTELAHALGSLSYHASSAGAIYVGVSAGEIADYDPRVGIASFRHEGRTSVSHIPVQPSTGAYTLSVIQQ